MKGVKELPGAICTLRRRWFEKISEATMACDVLEIMFKKNNEPYKGFLEKLTDLRNWIENINWRNSLSPQTDFIKKSSNQS